MISWHNPSLVVKFKWSMPYFINRNNLVTTPSRDATSRLAIRKGAPDGAFSEPSTPFGSAALFSMECHDRVHIKLTKQIDTFPVKIGSILKFTDIRFKKS